MADPSAAKLAAEAKRLANDAMFLAGSGSPDAARQALALCGEQVDALAARCEQLERELDEARDEDCQASLGESAVVLAALDLGLQAWRTTPSRERFTEAVAALGWLRERASRAEAAERRVALLEAALGEIAEACRGLGELNAVALARAALEGGER